MNREDCRRRSPVLSPHRGTLPFKGQVLTQTARFWFEATADLCPNHVIEYPDPNVIVARRLQPPQPAIRRSHSITK